MQLIEQKVNNVLLQFKNIENCSSPVVFVKHIKNSKKNIKYLAFHAVQVKKKLDMFIKNMW